MKEAIKAIVNDIQDVIDTRGWIGAMKKTVEFGNKQYHESWNFCEWGPERQAKLDGLNMGRSKKISAAHMTDGFRYICKPQWQAGTAVMTQKDIMEQYVLMRLFTCRQAEGVQLQAEQGYAALHAKLAEME